MYTIDPSRKAVSVDSIKGIIPFQILEHEPRGRALIIRYKEGICMSVKMGKKIVLYPMQEI